MNKNPGAAATEEVAGKGPAKESALSEREWQNLLRRIIDPRVGVIPVLGPDLTQVETAHGRIPLALHLARALAEQLSVSADDLDISAPFDTVAARHAAARGTRGGLNDELCGLIANLPDVTPEPLRQLAEIGAFPLYVTTAFDPLLSRAIAKISGTDPEVLAYAPRGKAADLPAPVAQLRASKRTVVYHLLGEPSTDSALWAVTEEDQLEFHHTLQNPNRQPKLLFSELQGKHLLFLGGGYPDWLARFFLRTLKGDRLSRERSVEEIVAVPSVSADSQLRTFLSRYSPQTHLLPDTDPINFVRELHSRYVKHYPARARRRTS